MIRLTVISPENEVRVAERLRALIAAAWPDVETSEREHVDLLVGVRTGVDVDLLAIVDLARPRRLDPQRRRNGPNGPAGEVQHAIVAIEIKQLDVRQFDRIGNQYFARYGAEPERRSVTDQAKDAATSIKRFLAQQQTATPFVYALAWLTELDDAALSGIDPSNLGASATWPAMLDACAQQHDALLQPLPPNLARALPGLRDRLLNRRIETRRDAARIERLSSAASDGNVALLLANAGQRQIQLTGRGGSGKTTTLALLAARLAEAGERVLVLTFHRTLRSDIAHLAASLAQRAGIAPGLLHVETTMGFLISALEGLGIAVPLRADGQPDWARLDATLDETRAMLVGGPDDPGGDAARLRERYPQRFAWDYVFVDESQDWYDAERDFLRALYSHRRLVLSDGMDQLVRRRVACNWIADVPAAERLRVPLDTSLRMLRNVALFACATAQAIGFAGWRVTPHESLGGGRVIVIEGDPVDAAFLRAVVAAAHEDKADPADCLFCVPHNTRASGDGRRLALLAAAAEAGLAVCDGTVPANRDRLALDPRALRIVRYDSCRGLEGWITCAFDLDDLVAQKIAYPNAHPGDPVIDVEQAALRWILIPLTRAVHTLIVTLRDPRSRTAEVLRQALDESGLPPGAVTWLDAAHAGEAGALLAPRRASSPSAPRVAPPPPPLPAEPEPPLPARS